MIVVNSRNLNSAKQLNIFPCGSKITCTNNKLENDWQDKHNVKKNLTIRRDHKQAIKSHRCIRSNHARLEKISTIYVKYRKHSSQSPQDLVILYLDPCDQCRLSHVKEYINQLKKVPKTEMRMNFQKSDPA